MLHTGAMTNGGLGTPPQHRRRAAWLAALVAALVVAGCTDDGGGEIVAGDPPADAAAVAATTTSASSSTTAASESAATAPSTTLPDPVVASGSVTDPRPGGPPLDLQLLVAGPDGIALWSAGRSTPVVEGRDVAAAWPDGRGGVIFQDRAAIDDFVRGVATPIWWVPALGAEPEVVVRADTPIHLQRVDVSGGHRRLSYAELVPNPEFCPSDDGTGTCAAESSTDLVVLDLDTGEELRFAGYTSWEYVAFSYDVGDELAVTQFSDYDTPFCLGVEPFVAVMAGDGGPGVCTEHPEPCPSTFDASTECRWWLGPAAISDDDRQVAYQVRETSGTPGIPDEVVVRDAATLDELRRIRIDAELWDGADAIELTSTGWIVLSRQVCTDTCASQVVAIGPDDTVYGPLDLPAAVVWSAG